MVRKIYCFCHTYRNGAGRFHLSAIAWSALILRNFQLAFNSLNEARLSPVLSVVLWKSAKLSKPRSSLRHHSQALQYPGLSTIQNKSVSCIRLAPLESFKHGALYKAMQIRHIAGLEKNRTFSHFHDVPSR